MNQDPEVLSITTNARPSLLIAIQVPQGRVQLRADWVCIVRSSSRSHMVLTTRKEKEKFGFSTGERGEREETGRRKRQ